MKYFLRKFPRHAEDTHLADGMSSGQLGEIMRDVGRTFPDHPFFAKTSPGEAMLARILKAIVSSRPDVGYCQVSESFVHHGNYDEILIGDEFHRRGVSISKIARGRQLWE